MSFGKSKVLIGLLAGLLLTTGVASPAPSGEFAGSLIGFVNNQAGVPQMGAAVFLYNNYDRLVGRALTNDKGAFGFESLIPGHYSVKVSLASFVPAAKDDVEITAGGNSFLSINLASVLSSIELIYSAPSDSKFMNDDWKWVLRTATPSRPILRIRPNIDISDPADEQLPPGEHTSAFSRTRGLVRVSTGEEGSLAAAGSQADLGTSFALATSLYGSNDLQFSGNFGYASNSGTPTAGFRTSYSNELWGTRPEVAVTMRQVMHANAGQAFLTGNQENAPKLRTMSISTLDRRQLTESLHLEYGASLESVAFIERLNYLSPYARLTADIGRFGAFELAYSSGMPPAELLANTMGPDTEMQSDLTVLALFPRISLVDGNARVQRAQNFEVAYRKNIGKNRSISASVYREGVTNAAVMMAAPGGYYSGADLLPDLSSNSSIFNAGDFERLGFRASATQRFAEALALTIAAGNGGVLMANTPGLASNDPNELREAMTGSRRTWAAARISGTLPSSGTQYSAGYHWTDFSVISPTHLYLTTGMQPELGLNVRIRQSLPSFGVWSGRLVASAELRNLLAQGYVPVATADGRTLYLIQNPRSVRGGVSFIF
jgi:carboxypeptidase family protein